MTRQQPRKSRPRFRIADTEEATAGQRAGKPSVDAAAHLRNGAEAGASGDPPARRQGGASSRAAVLPDGFRALKGRGARSNRAGRHERLDREPADDGWGSLRQLAREPRPTTIREEKARTIISRNDSPDICFERSVNPYRGCEHGCIYCYARPGHAWLGLSPGLDFESRIIAKVNAPALFARELRHPAWKPAPVAIAPATDAYQPAEKRYRLTRRLLEVAEEYGQPVGLITKSALITRDIDILARQARRNLVKVAVSITTLDSRLARHLEPRAATPARRLETIGALADAGIPVGVMVAPVIPALTDHEIETILARAAGAGAREAGYVMLRLPAEVSGLFREWLVAHCPDRAGRILALVREMHGGRDYDPRFGHRLVGAGPYAWAVGRRFELAARRLGLQPRGLRLATHHFRRPPAAGEQLALPGLLK
jgi:DNA repair photolyase